jgi:hypothetical protein
VLLRDFTFPYHGGMSEEQRPWTPRPWTPDQADPTKLTTDAVHAAVDVSRRELAAARELIDARFDAVDKSVTALRELLEAQIRNVQSVTREKFAAVDGTFASNALALTAALAAQEKAVAEQNKSNSLAIDKSEKTTKETIAANAAQASAGLLSQADTIADVKERVVRLETGGTAAAGARGEQRADREVRHFDDTVGFNRVAQSRQQILVVIAGFAMLVSLAAVIVSLLHG